MDRYSILDPGFSRRHEPPNAAQIGVPADLPQELPKVDALQLRQDIRVKEEPAISRARIPREENSSSIADIALSDLDAILQLLAERAEYITHATGAAIALWEGDEMVCRASAGPSAPSLGARLQVDSGLSGESIRTLQTLRCDDAETDLRVNRESCRALGISSVVVLPLIREHEVRGLFELFSDQPYAFAARDLEALERLGEMVDTALQHADAARANPSVLDAFPLRRSARSQHEVRKQLNNTAQPMAENTVAAVRKSSVSPTASQTLVDTSPIQPPTAPTKLEAGDKPLSTEVPTPSAAPVRAVISETKATVTPEIANIHKCESCGFPVSETRKLCLDCEAKSLPTNASASTRAPDRGPELSLGTQLSAEQQHWILQNKYVISAVLLFVVLVIAMLLSHSS
jgi:putative methionine-R-sulfoxide reductase with GAF domain